MKPFLSFFVILILFQTLIFGSLVKIELPEVYKDKWEETRIDKQVVLDPFLMPGKDGISRNPNYKNDWVPFLYNKFFALNNNSVLPLVDETISKSGTSDNYKKIPIYIQNATLRI